MFFRVIRKIVQRHLKYHLLIPLFIGLAIEAGTHQLSEKYQGVFWTWLGVLAPVLGILLAYLVVMYFIFKSETEMGMQRIASKTLEIALTNATGFLGIGAIELKEWFEPSTQVYLASIMKRKLENPNFTYNRVLIFSKSTFKDLNSPYLSGYYAKALIDIHKRNGIGLGYLKPSEIAAIMKQFKLDPGKAIGYYPKWLPGWLLKLTPTSWRGLWNRKLALAVIESGGKRYFLPFSKNRMIVNVADISDAITDEARNKAYDKLVTEITDRVLNGSKIEAKHDFSEYYS